MITKCPFILDLKPKVLIDRILYLSRKRFTREQISLIITKYPQWLLEEIDEVDSRLGAFQTLFGLEGMIIFIYYYYDLFCASPVHVTETEQQGWSQVCDLFFFAKKMFIVKENHEF